MDKEYSKGHSTYKGFYIEKISMAEKPWDCTRWKAWDIIEGHFVRFRADTLSGLKQLISDYKNGESV